MKSSGKILTEKKTIKEIFSEFWFRIPEYQRNYVWGDDEINELLNDLDYAMTNNSDGDYFLGSLVLQSREGKDDTDSKEKIKYVEYDVLDGQQRLTSLLILLAVIKDLTEDPDLINTCSEAIYQRQNKYKQTPERIRLDYKIRDSVAAFIDIHLKNTGGTINDIMIRELADDNNISRANMANAILIFRKYFLSKEPFHEYLSNFAAYLFNNVLLIYVATEELEDAFRLFTILNSRGIPLTNSDILKSINLV